MGRHQAIGIGLATQKGDGQLRPAFLISDVTDDGRRHGAILLRLQALPARNSFILAKKDSVSGLQPCGDSASKARSNSFCFLESLTGVSTRTSTKRSP